MLQREIYPLAKWQGAFARSASGLCQSDVSLMSRGRLADHADPLWKEVLGFLIIQRIHHTDILACHHYICRNTCSLVVRLLDERRPAEVNGASSGREPVA